MTNYEVRKARKPQPQKKTSLCDATQTSVADLDADENLARAVLCPGVRVAAGQWHSAGEISCLTLVLFLVVVSTDPNLVEKNNR